MGSGEGTGPRYLLLENLLSTPVPTSLIVQMPHSQEDNGAPCSVVALSAVSVTRSELTRWRRQRAQLTRGAAMPSIQTRTRFQHPITRAQCSSSFMTMQCETLITSYPICLIGFSCRYRGKKPRRSHESRPCSCIVLPLYDISGRPTGYMCRAEQSKACSQPHSRIKGSECHAGHLAIPPFSFRKGHLNKFYVRSKPQFYMFVRVWVPDLRCLIPSTAVRCHP